jgi:hypothetical protein
MWPGILLANLFFCVRLAHADPSTMIKFPTELFNLSEITF